MFSLVPANIPALKRKNFVNVQIDAVGVGIALAAYPFIPVLLARLGASNMQVGLFSSLPAISGLLFAIPLGRILESTKNIVRTFSLARLAVFLSNVAIGLSPLFLEPKQAVILILAITTLVNLPNTLVGLGFTIIMNEVAGPESRYELMSRRWALIQLSFSIVAAAAGFILSEITFPLGYAVVFGFLTVGALISYHYSRRIEIPQRSPSLHASADNFLDRIKTLHSIVLGHRALLTFNLRRFLLYLGVFALAPIYPLFFVRQLHASDFWIGSISTAQSATLLIGYFFWTEIRKRQGVRSILVWGMIGSSFYPFLVSALPTLSLILIAAFISGLFQAAVDLLLFDEMLKRIPAHSQAPLVSYSQSVFYLASIIGPFLGTFFAEHLNLMAALLIGASLRALGAISFCSLDTRDIADELVGPEEAIGELELYGK